MSKKSPEAFRTISEVADWLGVPTHVLRFWESRFAQVKPVKRAGGRRYYRPTDMELLGGIRKLLHDDGMTIRGVQKLLREEGVKHVAALSPQLDSEDVIDLPASNVVQLSPQAESEDTAATETPADEAAETPVDEVAASDEPAEAAPVSEATAPEDEDTPVAEAAIEAEEEEDPLDSDLAIEFLSHDAQPVHTEPYEPAFKAGEKISAEADGEDDLLDSPEAMEFLAHDADFTPPEAEKGASAESTQADEVAASAAAEDETEAEPTSDGDAEDDAQAPARTDISHIPADLYDSDIPLPSPGHAARLRELRGKRVADIPAETIQPLVARLQMLAERMPAPRR